MKKNIVLMILLTVVFGGWVFASKHSVRSGDDESVTRSAKKRLKKELKQKEKEEKKLKDARLKSEKNHQKELAKERKLEKQEAKKHEKELLKKKDAKKQDAKKEESARRLLELQVKKQNKKEQKKLEKNRTEEKNHHLILNDQKRAHDQAERYAFARHHRVEQMDRWHEMHALEVERDYEAGRYADLYKSPAWPMASGFFDKKDNLTVGVNYVYATDAYGDDRSRHDVTALAFGQQPITIGTIFGMAGIKAVAGNVAAVVENVMTDAVAAAVAAGGAGNADPFATAFTTVFGGSAAGVGAAVDAAVAAAGGAAVAAAGTAAGTVFATAIGPVASAKPISFNGKKEGYETSLNFARYILGDNIQVGVTVPVAYVKHTLNMGVDYKYYDAIKTQLETTKGIKELGGSATGIGDLALYASVSTGARTFEKVLTGVKVTLPTAKAASTAKLWAPQLGQGYTQFTLFGSALMDYSRLLNPYVHVEGTWAMPAHFNKRLLLIAAGTGITIRGFADEAVSVKMSRGFDMKLHVGNIIEKFIARRGFLDIFYDLTAKMKDSIRGQSSQTYNLDKEVENTHMLAHKLGIEYQYQFDAETRWKVGMNYVFAGLNAPKTFEVGTSLGCSF